LRIPIAPVRPGVAAQAVSAYTGCMILGHAALAVIAKQTYFSRENVLFLVAASLFPDILDKPMSLFFSLPGRGVGHSLAAFAAIAGIAWVLAPRLRLSAGILISGAVMWLTHLASDFTKPQVLFWPLLGSLEPSPRFDVWEKIYQFYVARIYPEQFWLDVACIAIAVSLTAVNRMRSRIPAMVRQNSANRVR